MHAALRVLAIGFLAAQISCGGRSQNRDDSDNAGEGGTGGSRGGRIGSGGDPGPLGGANTNGGGTPGGTAGAPGGTTGAIGGTTGATSGTAGAFGGAAGTLGGTGGTGGRAVGFVVEPDATGCVGRVSLPEESPVQGCFYVLGDQYPGPTNAKCLLPGMHSPSECSIIESPPPPPAIGFPHSEGVMCTTGTVAQVLPCAPTVLSSGCPMYDFENMWGAGIAFDFNADKNEEGGAKRPWDAADGGFIGFSFEIDVIPLSGLRVEIPMVLTDEEAARATTPLASGSTTDSHADGSPYWGASLTYPNSPVIRGKNRVLWNQIMPPRPQSYTFDTARMIGIQWHVPANTSSRGAYEFCIWNLTLLRE